LSGRPAVFLDRDGVLNEAPVVDGVPRAPSHPEDLRILADAPAGCAALRDAGFLLVGVTNQPEIARGRVRAQDVARINDRLAAELGLTEIAVCPHDDADNCGCRKPKPGLTLQAAERHGIDLSRSFTVGDRWRDVEAGRNAGTRTVFVDRDYDEPLTVSPDATVGGLQEASEWIVQQLRP
jgi:D-glycero-D-manno-heptose 1,7-bisphosphate phosphatase